MIFENVEEDKIDILKQIVSEQGLLNLHFPLNSDRRKGNLLLVGPLETKQIEEIKKQCELDWVTIL